MSCSRTNVPFGQRLLLPLLEQIAETEPQRIYASIPKTQNFNDGYRDVTYRELYGAVNRAAAWLEDTFHRSSTFETLAYIGPSDIKYFILVLAAPYVGYKFLLTSPRNSNEGQISLLRDTRCTKLLTSKGFYIPPGILSGIGASVIETPDLDKLLAEDEVRKYKFEKPVAKAEREPFIVLHTSGSTGLPKPIEIVNGFMHIYDEKHLLPSLGGFQCTYYLLENRKLLLSMPPFHLVGIVAGIVWPLYFNVHLICQPSGRPVSAVSIEEALDYANPDTLFTAPSILEELSQSPTALEKLSRLKTITFAGGPLSRRTGDILSKKTKLLNSIGSTETGGLPLWDHDAEDWEYFHFNPAVKGVDFRPTGDGETYELVFVRHSTTDPYHGTWWTFPHLREYSTKDIYSKHPIKPNLWLYVGRIDDIIVFSNGEKLNPVSMETKVQEHPYIKGVIIVGQGEFAPAAVIELDDHIAQSLTTQPDRANMVEKIWPKVMEANNAAPGHGQVAFDMILIADPKKPFPRVGKGTVQRKAVAVLYRSEIEKIYQQSGADGFKGLPEIDLASEHLEEEVGKLVKKVLHVENLSLDQDFFSIGMDSLHVVTIAKQLKAAIDGIKDTDTTGLIYSNSTVSTLATALKGVSISGGDLANNAAPRSIALMQILEEYLCRLPIPTRTKKAKLNSGLTVILTGSTGSLGSYILDVLFSNRNVSKIYCLNRRADAAEYQAKANAARSLVSQWADRVVFLHADLSKEDFNLPTRMLEALRNETSVIIHNQWPVNFNLALHSFEPMLEGVLSLIKLSLSSLKSPPIYFMSSVSTVANWADHGPRQSVPELALDDPALPTAQGYSESKWVAERLLHEAGKFSGLSSAILRIGQIAGPVEGSKARSGMWNRQEWLPSIIASSRHLGVIPKELRRQDAISWIPVDLMSRICVDLIEADCIADPPLEDTWTKCYHLTNPKYGSWAPLTQVIQDYFTDEQLKPVEFHEWVDVLQRSEKDSDVNENPALKLLGFYSKMRTTVSGPQLDTVRAIERSKTMQTLKPVNEEWMKLWMEQWRF